MEEFNQHISEMESLVKAMAGNKKLSTQRYSFARKGIKDNKTGVMLFLENEPRGVLMKLIHPKINSEILESRIQKAGYCIKEKMPDATIYSLGDNKDNLPDMIVLACGGKEIGYLELNSRERAKCLAPIKSLLNYLSN